METLYGNLKLQLIRACLEHSESRGDAWHERAKRIDAATASECATLADSLASAVDDLGYPCVQCGVVLVTVEPERDAYCAGCAGAEAADFELLAGGATP